jgi:hypothetical protein
MSVIELLEANEQTEFTSEYGRWRALYRVRRDGEDRYVISELIIRPIDSAAVTALPPLGGITQAVLRTLRLREDRDFAQQQIRWARAVAGLAVTSIEEGGRADAPGRPRKTLFYLEVERRLAELHAQRKPRPNKILEQEFRQSQSAMASIIWRLRRWREAGRLPAALPLRLQPIATERLTRGKKAAQPHRRRQIHSRQSSRKQTRA